MGTLLLVVLLLVTTELGASNSNSSDATGMYDVTTMYRFHELENSNHEEAIIPNCYYGDNTCEEWNRSGWKTVDSNQYSNEFPPEEFSMASSDPPQVFPYRGEKQTVSLKPSSPNGDVFLLFLAEDDINSSDMLVVHITTNNQGLGRTFRCLKNNVQDLQYPFLPDRWCTQLDNIKPKAADEWNTTEFQSLTVEITNGNLKIVTMSNQKTVLDSYILNDIPELEDRIKFIGIKLKGVYTPTKTITWLELDGTQGSLESYQQYPSHSFETLMCIQLMVRFHPLSRGSIAVSLVFKNNTQLKMGRIRPVGNQIRLWRFVSRFSSTPHRISIKSRKTDKYNVAITGITSCTEMGNFSQSVVNLPMSVEVRARVTARGLPFRLGDGTIKSPNVGVDLPDCVVGACDWKTTNFDPVVTSSYNVEHPFLDIGKLNAFSESSTEDPWISNTRRFHNALTFHLSNERREGGYFNIILMDKHQDISLSDMYIIRYSHSRYEGGSLDLLKCTLNGGNLFQLTNGVQRYCTHLGSKDVYDFNNEARIVRVKLMGSSLEVSVEKSQSILKEIKWTVPPDNPIIPKYFAVHSSGTLREITGTSQSLVLSLFEPQGSLVSPPIPRGLDRVCISLIYYADTETKIDILLQKDGSSVLLATKPIVELLDWRNQNIIVNIPNDTDSKGSIVVSVTKHEDRGILLIQRVAGCNAEGSEDALELPTTSRTTIYSYGVDIVHNFGNFSVLQDNLCKNGGLRIRKNKDTDSKERCACPAGFTGDSCEKGCGANSYGEDCGGTCSDSEQGCRGMILCRPHLGCNCAPGFKGVLCDTLCSSGEYGAGCHQKCGDCFGDSCDVYTGRCHHGCQDGRFPPFCQQNYSYVSRAPTVAAGFDNVSVSVYMANRRGYGDPTFYQIQYKEETSLHWHKLTPQPIVQQTGLFHTAQVTGLKSGVPHLLRVVLIDQSLSSYQGEHVPVVKFSPLCIIPKEADYQGRYQLSADHVTADSFNVKWQFPDSSGTRCPITGFELLVKLGWRWVKHVVETGTSTKVIEGLSSGEKYVVKLRAVTRQGPAAFLPPLEVTTTPGAPSFVESLEATEATPTSLTVRWDPPKRPTAPNTRYLVTYQCNGLGACPEADCSQSLGKIQVATTNVAIDSLLPYALYNVSVAALSSSSGPTVSLLVATAQSAPNVAPSPARPAVLNRSNSSFEVQWLPPESCSLLNGYLSSYRYELLASDQVTPLMAGSTSQQVVSFDSLMPHSTYTVRVFAVTSSGWNRSHPLDISAKTRATTPAIVGDVAVYKRGRRMLGLRWSKPQMTYGSLESFTVTYRSVSGTEGPISATTKPSACPAWPELFCHTLERLQPDTDYRITVQARNAEVSEDGEEVSVLATTKEGAPGAPSFLHVVNKTSTSLTIEWGLPDMVNGQLRSFLVNLEETDSINSTDCCQYFPLREVIVTSETSAYKFEAKELRPASRYEVGVSAKTIALGPAVTLTVHTRPLTPSLLEAPKLLEPAVVGIPLRVRVTPSKEFEDELVGGYLLLLAGDSIEDSNAINNQWLATQIKLELNQTFSLVAEFTQAPLAGSVLTLRPGQTTVGHFGSVGFKNLVLGNKYRLVWAMVLEYYDSLSVGFVLGESFAVG